MKLPERLLAISLLVALVACQSSTSAQESDGARADTSLVVPAPEARMSPMAVAAGRLASGAYVKVVYSSPRKRGRTIFGGLVPFGEVWRTGANEATEITLTGSVVLGPAGVEAGTYSLFTIPDEDEWTIILNGNLGQWGAYDYDSAADVYRFVVPARKSEKVHEAFTITVDTENDVLQMVWDATQIDIPLQSPQ